MIYNGGTTQQSGAGGDAEAQGQNEAGTFGQERGVAAFCGIQGADLVNFTGSQEMAGRVAEHDEDGATTTCMPQTTLYCEKNIEDFVFVIMRTHAAGDSNADCQSESHARA